MPIWYHGVLRPAALGGGFEEKYVNPFHFPVLNGVREVECMIQRLMDLAEATKKQA